MAQRRSVTILNKKRLVIAFIIFAAVMVLLCFRVGYIQIVKGDDYKRMLVLSPGVPTDLPFVKEAAEAGAEIAGELEIAFRCGHGKYVAITGTNGKTTTTTLVGEIFRNSGRKTEVVGNIGVAVISKAMEAADDTWMITETSSFQLETVSTFRPVVSAILNLTPDHMNRHHTMENYGRVKSNVFMNRYLMIR